MSVSDVLVFVCLMLKIFSDSVVFGNIFESVLP
jgi:hypothetical protein